MNDDFDNSKMDKEILRQIAEEEAKLRRKFEPPLYKISTNGFESEGTAEHVLGIATYLHSQGETQFFIWEIRRKNISYRTLKNKVEKSK